MQYTKDDEIESWNLKNVNPNQWANVKKSKNLKT